VALIFTLSADAQDDQYQQYDQAQQQQQGGDSAADDKELAVTSRAMAFAAMWTAVLATLLAIFGAVVLGWQSPTGVYYTCCSPQVHRTTPLALGSFIGALLMFANMTLVCSILFGEFDVSCSFYFFVFRTAAKRTRSHD
jgi:vacuolar-type H+-ATPase subunit I/STV1